MKIAICFSGQIREMHKSFDYWKKITEEYNLDVYGSFWERTEEEKLSEDITQEELFYKLNPIKCEWENPHNFESSVVSVFREEIIEKFSINDMWPLTPDLLESTRECRFFYLWYKVMKCNSLCQDKNYDIVIRTRTDIYFEPFPDLEINGYLNLVWGCTFNDKWLNNGGPPDQFAYGSQKNMNYYSSLFIYLSRYLKEGAYMFPPENILKTHLMQFKITLRQLPSRLHYFKDDGCFNQSWGVTDILFSEPYNYPKEIDPIYSFYRERYSN
jgi:hypothetical protein